MPRPVCYCKCATCGKVLNHRRINSTTREAKAKSRKYDRFMWFVRTKLGKQKWREFKERCEVIPLGSDDECEEAEASNPWIKNKRGKIVEKKRSESAQAAFAKPTSWHTNLRKAHDFLNQKMRYWGKDKFDKQVFPLVNHFIDIATKLQKLDKPMVKV